MSDDSTYKINSVFLTPKNDKFVTFCGNYRIKVWQVESGACLLTIKTRQQCISSIHLCDNGNKIITAHSNSIKLWDTQTGEFLNEFHFEESFNLNSSDFYEEKNEIALISFKGEIILLHVAKWEEIIKFDTKLNFGAFLLYSYNGRVLLTGYPQFLKLWDTRTGSLIRDIPKREQDEFCFFTTTSCQQNLIIFYMDGLMRILNLKTRRFICKRQTNQKTSLLRYHKQLKAIFVGGHRSDKLKVWKEQSPKPIFEEFYDKKDVFLDFSINGETFVTYSSSKITISKMQRG